jgi:hypothetical protein
MLIHSDAYRTLYHDIDLNGVLIDTWYLFSEGLGEVTLPTTDRAVGNVRRFVEIVPAVRAALSGRAKLSEVSATLAHPYRPSTYIYESLFTPAPGQLRSQDRSGWEALAAFLDRSDASRTSSLTLYFDVTLRLRGELGEIRECRLRRSFEVHILSQIDRSIAGAELPRYVLSLASNFRSIAREDNDADVLLIYLHHLGVLTSAELPDPEERVRSLLATRDLGRVVEQVKAKPLRVNPARFETYRHCVLKLGDAGPPLCGNGLLAALNKGVNDLLDLSHWRLSSG